MKTTPFFYKCLSPIKIINPYNKEPLIVSCGKCDACQQMKSSVYTLKCKLESKSHKYSYFVTLTYSNDYIPSLNLHYEHKGWNVASNDGWFFGWINSTYTDLNMLREKTHLNGDIPYLEKRDLQLFIKRLRYYVDRECNESIRYYGVGEYGPVHFRPHYHIILWFEKPQTATNLARYVDKCWPFGFTYTEKVLDDCSTYVAGYVNSNSELPKVYQLDQTKPFCVHSHHLGEQILYRSKEEVYKLHPKEFIQRSIVLNGVDSEFTLWRSIKDYFFPKCVGYSVKSSRERLYSYKLYDIARRWTGETEPSKQARLIFKTFEKTKEENTPYVDIDAINLIKYFFPNPLLMYEYTQKVRQIYLELRISKHFLEFVCDSRHIVELESKLSLIENFYSKLDLLGLQNQLEQIDYFIRYVCGDIDDLKYLYSNLSFDVEEYKQTKTAQIFESMTKYRKEMFVKHKKLNDQNKIFINI